MILDKIKGIMSIVKDYKHIKGIITATGAISAALVTGATVHNTIKIKKMSDNSLDISVSTKLQDDINNTNRLVNSTVSAVEEVSTQVEEQINRIDSIIGLSDKLTKEVHKNRSALRMVCTGNKLDKSRKDEILRLLDEITDIEK